MNPEVKAAWVAALESGEYTQAASLLKADTGGNCCLGVLCELAVNAGVIPPPVFKGDHYGTPFWHYDGETLTLPASVSVWAGFTGEHADNPTVLNPEHDPDYDRDDIEPTTEPDEPFMPWAPTVNLAELNDADAYENDEVFVHRYPFPAIANLIREHL